jgi:4-amino-4-deoxy-L-arabinose transferase-like glycosyltransferase
MKKWLLNHRWVLLIIGLYLGACALYFTTYMHQLNPDGVSYLSLAHYFSEGHIKLGINTYWSPLLPMLLTPFFWLFHAEPTYYAKLLNVLLGAGTLFVLFKLLQQLVVNATVRLVTVLCVAPFMFAAALPGPITPDLLFAFLFIIIAYLCLRLTMQSSVYGYIALGALGGLLFLAKAVGLYIFPLALVILGAYHYFNNGKKWSPALKKNLLVALVSFAVIAVGYIGVLSIKYHKLTVGTSGPYNLMLVMPHSPGHPTLSSLYEPPHPRAVSAWEEITKYHQGSWRFWQSWNDMTFFINNVLHNFFSLQNFLVAVSIFIPGVLLLEFFGYARKKVSKPPMSKRVLLAALGTLSALPFLPLFFEARYILAASIIFIVLCVCFLYDLMQDKAFYRQIRFALMALFLASLLYTPIVDSFVLANSGKDTYDKSFELRKLVPAGSKIASSDFNLSLNYCYYIQAKCYGTVPLDTKGAVPLLHSLGIQYLLLNPADYQRLQKEMPLVQLGPLGNYEGLTLYRQD